MLDCIKHMTTIGKWRKPIFIGPHTDCYSRKKYGRSLFFELEEILEVDPKIKGARSCFIFYKAYETGVDDNVAINPRFAAITIIRRFPFVDFPHARALRTSFSSKQASKQTTQTLRPAEHNFRKIDNTRNLSEVLRSWRSSGISLSWTNFFSLHVPSGFSLFFFV